MTYRERRLAKAERLQGWADKRTATAHATQAANDALPYAHDLAFITQPGRIVARERLNASDRRAHESLTTAAGMSARADSIIAAADAAIYSDDPDAIERLAAKIATLEAQRTDRVAANVTYRAAHRAELAGMTPYQRECAVPWPGYSLSNLTGNIGTARKRLAGLMRDVELAAEREHEARECDRIAS